MSACMRGLRNLTLGIYTINNSDRFESYCKVKVLT